MDTIQIIKINEDKILISFINKTIKLDLKFDNLKDKIRKINYNILDGYVKSGTNPNQLKILKETSYDIFNILNFFEFKNYFKKIKKNEFNHIQLILDDDTNLIPFELLHDGKDFLSDYIIFSRSFINSKEYNSLSKSDKAFTVVGNPSESDDIMQDINDEFNYISNLIRYSFDLRGPYTKRYVNKIELINLLSISSYFHFSGHYIFDGERSGWRLFDDIFTDSDISKISNSPKFLFSNSCGSVSGNFINSFLEKGTKSIISSSGKLPSKKASEFSQNFYNYFIVKNLNLGESFFLARRDIINQYGKNDLFWCFYQIYGSGLLKINKKSNNKNKKKNNPLKFLSLSMLLILFSLFIFNYFKNQNHKEEESKFILENLVIMKNDKHIGYHPTIDSSKNTINISGKDSIYFKLVDNQPIFSLNPNFEGLEIFIHDSYSVETLFDYKQNILNLNFKNRKVYDDDTYHHIHLNLGPQYEDIEVYMKKIDIDVFDYELFLLDKNNYKRYKIKLSELINHSQTYGVITINELERFADPQKSFKYGGFSDKFDLIKDTQFNKELHLYIKKALINN